MSDAPFATPSGGHDSVGEVQRAAAKIDQIRISTGHHGLCFRCRYAFVTKRANDLEAKVLCTQIGKSMPPDIAACSRVLANGQLTVFELIQMCDPMDVLSKQRPGFRPD